VSDSLLLRHCHTYTTAFTLPEQQHQSRSTQFADDVLFLARDHLRLDEHSKCNDETTRLTAEFLKRQARLAVLNGHGAADGIVLTCGHHCATKIGTALYSSVRAMVPVLRNRYVFFQFRSALITLQ
jgi:hypothetical protein